MYKSDLEIAQASKMKFIKEVADKVSIDDNLLIKDITY